MNLRGEWARVVFEELYYAVNNQKIADKKKAHYQEGLEKSRADSAARSHDSYMKDPEKSCARSCESYMKDPEKSRVTVQHEAAKLHEGFGKESCWQCSMKPWNLQERLGEESLKWNWLGYILQK